LKLGIVVPSFSPFINSNERGLAGSLAKNGHDVTVITTTAIDDRSRPYVERGANTEGITSSPIAYEIRYLPCKLLVKNNAITWGIGAAFNDYDVLLVQEDYPFLSKLCSLYALRRGIPFLISCERYYYSNSPLSRSIVAFLDHTAHRAMWRLSFALTFHSRASMEFYLRNSAPKEKSMVIPVGIDTSHFNESTDGENRSDGKIRILCVARLESFKGQEYLIKAIKILKNNHPNLELRILGRGSKEWEFRNLINKLKLGDTISLDTTPVKYEAMPHIYHEHDVYVQPSLIEPFGIAVLEAMACGKPVIGTCVGGMRDTIVDNGNGFLVPPGDAQALAAALSKLLTDSAKRTMMGKESRRRAKETFDWDKVSALYLKLLENAC
jgi:glycosyltransferase involved in cell wall biosynthesis